MKQISHRLEAEMAKAISIIVAASHAAANEALDEAFGVARQGAARKNSSGAQRQQSTRVRSSPRRTNQEIAALEAQLLDAVCATPGEAMSVLAPRVGVSSNELQVPIARLKAAGRLKTVGERHRTRYFPAERGETNAAGDVS